MEIREVEIREIDEELRQVTGLAVPYGQVTEVGGYKESFERGAFDDDADATLFYGHDHRTGGMPIGKLVKARNTDDGYEVTAQISKTTKGDEAYTLLRDGVVKSFSVGFEPVKHSTKDGVVVRTKAKLLEVSIVPMPAYSGASISEVREDSALNNTKEIDNMSTDTNVSAEVAELREEFADFKRETLASKEHVVVNEAPQFRTGGEILKGLLTGDDKAKNELRTYSGATVSDASGGQAPTWLQRPIQLVQENRNIFNLFNKQALPAQGMTVTYPQYGSQSGDVAVTAEGADLPYLELVVTSATANVVKYGGYSSLTREVIEREDSSYLTNVLEMQAISYAKVTNGVVRTVLTAGSGFNTYTMSTANGDNTTAKGWINAVLNAQSAIAANSIGLKGEFMIVSPTTFGKIANVVDNSGRPVFVLNGDGSNTIGNVNVTGLTANIAGLPVVVDDKLTGENAYVVSSRAVTVLESAGAPFRLQDDNIINLTKDFSLYGYLATTLNDVKGVTKVNAANAA